MIAKIEQSGRVGFILPGLSRSRLSAILEDTAAIIEIAKALGLVFVGVVITIYTAKQFFTKSAEVPGVILIIGIIIIIIGFLFVKNALITLLPHHSEVWISQRYLQVVDCAGWLRTGTKIRRKNIAGVEAFSLGHLLIDSGQSGRSRSEIGKRNDVASLVLKRAYGRPKQFLDGYDFELLSELASNIRVVLGNDGVGTR